MHHLTTTIQPLSRDGGVHVAKPLRSDPFLSHLEQALEKKFESQQKGKLRWLCNRELKYDHFFLIEFKNDQQFVLNHIRKYGFGLSFASEALKGNKEFLLQLLMKLILDSKNSGERDLEEAIKDTLNFLSRVDKELQYNRDFVLQVVRQYGKVFKSDLDINYQHDREIVLAAVKQDGRALKYVSECSSDQLKQDQEVVFEAIRQNKKALRWASRILLEDEKFMLKALRLVLIPELDQFHYSNKKIMCQVVKEFSFLLEFASQKLKSDKKMVFHAVSNDGLSLQHSSQECKNDKEIVLKAVQQNGLALEFVATHFKNDHEIVRTAILQNGNALRYASSELRNDSTIVLEAIQQCSQAFTYASKELKENQEFLWKALELGCEKVLKRIPYSEEFIPFVMEVVKKNGLCVSSNNEFCYGRQVMLEAIQNHGFALYYASEKLKSDEELAMIALKCHGYVLDHERTCNPAFWNDDRQLYQARMDHCYFDAFMGNM
ncbi:hypothetical protein FDP41_008778 [Naegleria fowleri]|uniref:DUF4116 domain-containing protein n=1 Tax=Naegleria fowleri TaxID=5763 RepID=A0A6A5BE75_NAEFO|nr:uncharacterized protein FDP41_008778 [Naegleria fowleri]KAF0972926.1 hypothetical protein FDP41_008778 [Naegleria fowleri]